MIMRHKIKRIIMEKNIDLVGLVNILILPIVVLMYFLLKGILIHVTYFFEPIYPISLELKIPLPVGGGILVLIFFILCIIYLFQSREIRMYKEDKGKDDFINEIVILNRSESIAKNHLIFFLPNLLSLFFWKSYPSYQKSCFFSVNKNEKGYFYYIISKDILKNLLELYSVNCSYWDIGIWVKNIDFCGNIPLSITYGKNSHVLKSVDYVSDYAYSESQINAIKNLNQICSLCGNENDFNAISKNRKISQWQSFNCNISLKILFATLLLLVACIISFFLWTIIGLFDSMMHESGFWLELFGLCFMFYILCLQIPNRGGKTRRKKRQLLSRDNVTEKMELIESYTLNVLHSSLAIIFREEKASNQRLVLKRIDRSSVFEEYEELVYTVSRDKIKVLSELCDLRCEYDKWGPMSIEIYFGNSVPLQVTYNHEYRLIRLDPIEDFSYTNAQLAAIEKFNTLYP